MERYLGRWSAQIYAIFRIVVGLLFLQHGAQKVLGVLGGSHSNPGHPEAMWTQSWVGGVIELTCGLAVALGFQAGWAAFLASGTMAVAYFQFHQKFTEDKLLPIQNGGELAVVYCFVFLLIASKGSGIWSVSGPRHAS